MKVEELEVAQELEVATCVLVAGAQSLAWRGQEQTCVNEEGKELGVDQGVLPMCSR